MQAPGLFGPIRSNLPTGNWTGIFLAAINGEVGKIRDLICAGNSPNMVDEWGLTPLMYAVRNARVSTFHLLLRHRANVNAVDSEGNSVLLHSVHGRNLFIFRRLLALGANVNYCNKENMNALMVACRLGVEPLVTFMLEHYEEVRAAVNKSDVYGNTALHFAADNEFIFDRCVNASSKIIETLVHYGGDLHRQNDIGDTALTCSVLASNVFVLETLLHLGAVVDVANVDGRTPLMCASFFGHISCVQCLLEHGADIEIADKGGDTALTLACQNACRNAQERVVALLFLSFHTNVTVVKGTEKFSRFQKFLNKKNCSDYSPLMAAMEAKEIPQDLSSSHGTDNSQKQSYQRVVLFLLMYGAEVQGFQSKTRHENLLMIAAIKDDCFLADLFLRCGIPINSVDSDSRTAFMCAAQYGNVNMLRFLYSKIADVNACTTSGANALVIAVIYRQAAAVTSIMSVAGIDVKKQCDLPSTLTDEMKQSIEILPGINPNMTALNIAIIFDCYHCVKILLSCGVNWKNEETDDPLFLAVNYNRQSIFELIGHDSYYKSIQAQKHIDSALFCACRHGFTVMIQRLIDFGASMYIVDVCSKVGLNAVFVAILYGHLEAWQLLLSADLDMDCRTKSGLNMVDFAKRRCPNKKLIETIQSEYDSHIERLEKNAEKNFQELLLLESKEEKKKKSKKKKRRQTEINAVNNIEENFSAGPAGVETEKNFSAGPVGVGTEKNFSVGPAGVGTEKKFSADSFPKKIPEEHAQDLQLEDECVICFEKRREYALDPCGHRCVCLDCVRNMFQSGSRLCPLCSVEAEKYLRIFV